MVFLDEKFWSARYQAGATGWDVGMITTPLKAYIDQLEDTELQILIPGAGNGYEAEYLVEKGFTNITVLDLSPVPLERLKKITPEGSVLQLLCVDFFVHSGSYDLILEQTFFCALDPSLRQKYVQQMQTLLKPSGKLVGVLFDDPLFDDRPPFGGDLEEYRQLFDPYFRSKVMDRCYNSIPPRRDREIFINLSPSSTTM